MDSPVFLSPLTIPQEKSHQWRSVTYAQFFAEVEGTAQYWIKTFAVDNIPSGSVVGLWLSGWEYTDIVQIYAILRAQYVPQLFSLKLSNSSLILELMESGNAKAMICDSQCLENFQDSPVPVYPVAIPKNISNFRRVKLPPVQTKGGPEEILMVFHTSGSTSGSPKLVPYTRRWLGCAIEKSAAVCKPAKMGYFDVTTWLGSACHVGQTSMFLGYMYHGACTILPSQPAFTSTELQSMITSCGLNRLTQYATFLSAHLRNAEKDPGLLSSLRALDELLYSGLELGSAEKEWAYSMQLPLKNLLGSTECGPMMLSDGPISLDLLKPLDGTSYAFYPIQPSSQKKREETLTELVVLGTSLDCPHQTLLSKDGHFHTGDHFREVTPGRYMFCGRNDDWIKSENGLRCDVKAIEDHVKRACRDLVFDCVVVGAGRPSPALIIEPMLQGVNQSQLRQDIWNRIQPFQVRRYLHEQIAVRAILVVEQWSLPRTMTKGNIRRQAAETVFKTELDIVYGRSQM